MRAALAALALAALALAAPAAAHRGHSSLSVVEIDAATGAVTVTHRLSAHDVEPFLVTLAPEAQPSLDDPDAMAAFRTYAGQAFRVWDARGGFAELTFQSSELTADDVRLTYRTTLPPPALTLSISSTLLHEGHDDQENQVNVRRAGVTRTVVFRPGSEDARISFNDDQSGPEAAR